MYNNCTSLGGEVVSACSCLPLGFGCHCSIWLKCHWQHNIMMSHNICVNWASHKLATSCLWMRLPVSMVNAIRTIHKVRVRPEAASCTSRSAVGICIRDSNIRSLSISEPRELWEWVCRQRRGVLRGFGQTSPSRKAPKNYTMSTFTYSLPFVTGPYSHKGFTVAWSSSTATVNCP